MLSTRGARLVLKKPKKNSTRVCQDLEPYRLPATRLQKHSSQRLPHCIMDLVKKSRPMRPSSAPTVCIVGAGISGLRCADILTRYGCQVTILEARDRIGGRAHQATLPCGAVVDLGPNWIHGTDNNPILNLAKETDTSTHLFPDHTQVFDENGNLQQDGKQLTDIMWSIVAEAFKCSSTNTSTIDPKVSMLDFYSRKVVEMFPHNEDSMRRKMLVQMCEMWGAFVGSPIATQSLRFLWLEECIEGENLLCSGTYTKIVKQIARPATERAVIRLSTKVTAINSYSDNITVETYSGQTFRYDEIVVTAPLGWLQKNKDVFQPELPRRFSEAVDSIGYGTLDKIYITFPRASWINDTSRPEDENFNGFTQWIAPAFSKDNPKRWNQECVDLACLPGASGHPTLLYYIYGDQSVDLSAQLALRPEKQERHDYLAKFFKPYFSLLPGYSESSPDCAPSSCLATDWVADDLAGNGSYTTFRTGLEKGDEDIEIMREGLPGRSVWFAGEHTAPFAALGTTTGAYWSGELVGRRIAEAYGMALTPTSSQSDVSSMVTHTG